MIVSASYRTDIPAFYGAWFAARLDAGFAMVPNPYGSKPYRVSLRAEDVDGFVFWTRNAKPFLPVLDRLAAAGRPFVVSYTVTGYPELLDRSVPPADHGIAVIRDLARRFGPRAAVWRYDPVVWSDATPPAFHEDRVARLADALAGAVDECVLSPLEPYAKTRRRTSAAAASAGIGWTPDPGDDARRDLFARLAAILGDRGIAPTICSRPDLDGIPGTLSAKCVDTTRLSDVAGRPIAARIKGNRPGCRCAESRDIGAYDSCPHGCVYCYAVSDGARAAAARAAHDPAAETLISGARRGT